MSSKGDGGGQQTEIKEKGVQLKNISKEVYYNKRIKRKAR